MGSATSTRLAAEGALVMVGDINESAAQATVEKIRAAGGTAKAFQFDLADEASTNALIQAAITEFGGIDGLANIAADLSPETMAADLDVLDMNVATWQRVFRVNTIGTALCCREAIGQFVKQGTGGAIVNISSAVANDGEDTRPAYAASKAAVQAVTRQIALRWGTEGIRCNSVAPGITLNTRSEASMPPEFKEKWLKMTTLHRFGRPDDLAATISFLLSDDAKWVSGQVWHVNGGSHFNG